MTIPQPASTAPAKPYNIVALITAILLGVWAEYLFFGQPLGLNVFAFFAAGTVGLILLARHSKIQPMRRNFWLGGTALLLAGFAGMRAAQFTTWLNLLAALGVTAFWAFLFTSGDLRRFKMVDYFAAAVVSSFEITLFKPPSGMADFLQQVGGKQNSQRLRAVLRGLFLTVPLVIVLTLLLTSADAAFNQAVMDVLRLMRLDNLSEIIRRLLFWFAAAWISLGGLFFALREVNDRALNNRGSSPIPAADLSKGSFGMIESGIVLGSVDALFAAFVVVQFRYFFGGQANITVAGYTYAEYARRGFAELVVVALFVLGLALLLHAVTRRSNQTAILTFEGLSALLIVLTGIILVSAFRRLNLYEDAYGFTQLRLYTHIFIVMLGALLLAFLVCLHFNRADLFLFCSFVACLGFVATLNLLNTDAFIARQNIARYQQSGKLDAAYLASLSDDAIPELLPLLQNAPADDRQIIGSALHFRLNELEADRSKISWAGWNLASIQAYNLLQGKRTSLEQYPAQKYEWTFPID